MVVASLRLRGGQVSSATDDDQINYLLYSGTTRPTDLGGLSNSFRIKNVSLGVYLVYSFAEAPPCAVRYELQ